MVNLQQMAQLGKPALKMDSHGRWIHLEQLGCFAKCVPMTVDENDRNTLTVWEPVQRRDEIAIDDSIHRHRICHRSCDHEISGSDFRFAAVCPTRNR